MRHKTSEPYWICDTCAKTKGWQAPMHNVTARMGQCGYCKTGKKELLTPVIDYEKSKEGSER